MRLRTPQPPDDRGTDGGRPWWLWRPETEPPWPAMVILHGAGSRKENHADFGRLCAASGWLALSFDQRGHGEGPDGSVMSGPALGDVDRLLAALAEREPVDAARICARGSSMGGWAAIHVAATSSRVAAAIAICPAEESMLRRGLREGRLEMEADVDGLDAFLSEHDVREAAERMGAKPLILLHAMGDERVPYRISEEIYERKADPRKLVIMPGGNHRSIQHDAELQAVALRWIDRALAGREGAGALRPAD